MKFGSKKIALSGLIGLLMVALMTVGIVPASAAPPTASISGTVSAPAGINLDGTITVFLDSIRGVNQGSTKVAADGSYKFDSVAAGYYRVRVEASDTRLAPRYYGGDGTYRGATVLTVTGSEAITGKDIELALEAVITGKVTVPAGDASHYASVHVLQAETGMEVASTEAGKTGTYKIRSLVAGDYKVFFSRDQTEGLDQWYKNALTFEMASVVSLKSGQTVAGIDAVLARGGSISGNIVLPQGISYRDVSVAMYSSDDSDSGVNAELGANGDYRFYGLAQGSYKIEISGYNAGVLTRWYGGATSFEEATPIHVSSGKDVTGINPVPVLGGTIVGQVSVPAGMDPSDTGVRLYGSDPEFLMASEQVNADGSYALSRLEAGQYKVQFVAGNSAAADQWYNGAATFAAATPVSVAFGKTTPNIDGSLVEGGSVTGKVSLSDVGGRYPIDILDNSGALIKRGYSDGTGNYRITGLLAGSYKVAFNRASDSSPAEAQFYDNTSESKGIDAAQSVAVTALDTVPNIDANLVPGGSITGSLLDAAGKPLAYMDVVAFTKGDTLVRRTSYTDEAGRFTINGLSTGSYMLVAQPYGGNRPTAPGPLYSGNVSVEANAASIATIVGEASDVGVLSYQAAGPRALTASVPTVSGAAVSGQKLTAASGTWSPAPVTLAYTWQRDGVVIAGATGSSYMLTPADAGKKITVTVTGSKDWYVTASKTSAATAAVTLPVLGSPVPTVSGMLVSGQKLTANAGTWGPAPVVLAYQWKRNGAAIAKATASSYVLTAPDVGQKMTVSITGSKLGYSAATTTSSATAVVTAPKALTAPVPVVSGMLVTGQKLAAKAGSWGPAPVALTYQWKRNGAAIAKATAGTYVLSASDVGKKITVTVTGSKAGYVTAARTSAATAVVTAPKALQSATPVVTGKTAVGQKLSAKAGTWGPSPVALTYQWKRNGVAIAKASGGSYTVAPADLGKKITVTVTGTKTGYVTAAKTSAATKAVTAK